MRNYIEIGATPIEEDCAQVGSPNYRERATEETNRFIEQLRKQFGPEPAGTRLAVKWFPHDFGSYAEVVCFYDEDSSESLTYAFNCESEAWTEWEKV